MTEDTDYETRQRIADQEYRDAYASWVRDMPEEERAQLTALGLDHAHIETHGVGAPELDESRLADDIPWEGEETESSAPASSESLQDSLRAMLGELFGSDRPPLAIGIVCCALKVDGCRPERIAAKHKVDAGWVRDEATRMRFRMGIVCVEDEIVLARIAGELASTARARLSLEVLALVSGICYEGMSETEIAERHNVSRAAVSKRCVELAKKLDLPPSMAMKSEASRAVYSEAQKEVWGDGRRAPKAEKNI
jgi:hypothetical protein